MSAGDETRTRALSPFATTNYTEDTDGVLRAVPPSRCVCATKEQTCVMFVDHYRERKTPFIQTVNSRLFNNLRVYRHELV